MGYTLEEQETIIRFDRTDAPAMLYTASAVEAERWRKLGVEVHTSGARAWEASVPKGAVKIRRLVQGSLPRKPVSAAFLASGRKRKSDQ